MTIWTTARKTTIMAGLACLTTLMGCGTGDAGDIAVVETKTQAPASDLPVVRSAAAERR